MTKIITEICCGSLEDAINAEKAGVDRIELNNAMTVSGLTPSIGTLQEVLETCKIPVVAMARPRPGGFCYNEHDFKVMITDIKRMCQFDIEGVAFGCLNADGTIDEEKTRKIVEILKSNHKDAIFHRAFDSVRDPIMSIEILIELGVKRVLTSGLYKKAIDGIKVLKILQEKYGDKIEIVAGGGITPENLETLFEATRITQYHNSSMGWRVDPTTMTDKMSFAFMDAPYEKSYNFVDPDKARKFVLKAKELSE